MRIWLIWYKLLRSAFGALQAPGPYGFSFGSFASVYKIQSTPEVDHCGNKVVDALVVLQEIVMFDQRLDIRYQVY